MILFRPEALFILSMTLCLSLTTACGGDKPSSSVNSPYKAVGGSGRMGSGDTTSSGDAQTRMNNLEQRIDVIETDLRQLKPSIENLVAIEGDIQDLVKELASLTGERESLQAEMQNDPNAAFTNSTVPTSPVPTYSPSPNSATKSPAVMPNMNPDLISEANPETLPHARTANSVPPLNNSDKATNAPTPLKSAENKTPTASPYVAPTPAPTPASTPSAAVTNASSSVTDMRVAAHSPNKVRLAMDFKPGDDIKYDVQQQGSDVVLVMPQTSWNALKDWTSTKTPLISKYAASSTSDGSKLSISTKGDDLTVKVFTLGPVKPGAGPRLVIDFEKGT